jgi:hypothetical protein
MVSDSRRRPITQEGRGAHLVVHVLKGEVGAQECALKVFDVAVRLSGALQQNVLVALVAPPERRRGKGQGKKRKASRRNEVV